MKIKIEAKTLLPAVVHFAETYLTEDDFKVLKKCLKADKVADNISKDPIVKAGGLEKLLQTYLKSNKDLAKKIGVVQDDKKKRKKSESSSDESSDSEDEKPVKKRQRTMSNVSARSTRSAAAKSAKSEKSQASKKNGSKAKDKKEKTVEKSKSPVADKRKKSEEWTPKDFKNYQPAGPMKFARIDPDKFKNQVDMADKQLRV